MCCCSGSRALASGQPSVLEPHPNSSWISYSCPKSFRFCSCDSLGPAPSLAPAGDRLGSAHSKPSTCVWVAPGLFWPGGLRWMEELVLPCLWWWVNPAFPCMAGVVLLREQGQFFSCHQKSQGKFLWWILRTTCVCDYKAKYLEFTSGLGWFSKVVIVDSPPRSITSLSLGSGLDFKYKAWLPSCWVCLIPTRGWSVTASTAPRGYYVRLVIVVVQSCHSWIKLLVASLLCKLSGCFLISWGNIQVSSSSGSVWSTWYLQQQQCTFHLWGLTKGTAIVCKI